MFWYSNIENSNNYIIIAHNDKIRFVINCVILSHTKLNLYNGYNLKTFYHLSNITNLQQFFYWTNYNLKGPNVDIVANQLNLIETTLSGPLIFCYYKSNLYYLPGH